MNKYLKGASVAAVSAAVFSVVSRTTSKLLVGFALDRKAPLTMDGSKNRISGSSELAAANELAAKCAAALEKSGCEEVTIESSDGVTLVGHWYECPNAKRVIVAMHGWRSSWSRDFGVSSAFWHECGCSVLYAEQRGQNRSGGDYMGFGLLERYDCLAWAQWVSERTGAKLPVYLGGVSMGATTVLMATGLELPASVCGVIADCGFTSPYAIWKHVSENNLHIPYGFHSRAVDDLCRRRIQFGAKDYSTVEALQKCTVPVLFIHGTDDHFVPVEMTYENYRACTAPKELLIVPGAEHAMSYLVERARYEQTVKAFWAAHDGETEENGKSS